MEVNIELIDKLAHLARLDFSSDEKIELAKELEEMIGFVNKINELDTTGAEPLLHISENENVLRADFPGKCLTLNEVMKNSRFPDSAFFMVPKVINK